MRVVDGASAAASGGSGDRPPHVSVSRPARRAGRGRGCGRRLDRDQILRAALSLVDAGGLEALTMRRLGTELGCDPMSVYRHVPDRIAVLDGVVELVVEQLVVPAECGDWQQDLRASAYAFRALALAHHHVAPLLITRLLATPIGPRPLSTLYPLERITALLEDAGLTPANALHVHRAYTSFVAGHVLTELQALSPDPEGSDDLPRLGQYRQPPDEVPSGRALVSELVRYDGAAELDQGLDILLSGLRAHLLG